MQIEGIHGIGDFIGYLSERFPNKPNKYYEDDIKEFLTETEATEIQLQAIAKYLSQTRRFQTFPALADIFEIANKELGMSEKKKRGNSIPSPHQLAIGYVYQKNMDAYDVFKMVKRINDKILSGADISTLEISILAEYDVMVYNAYARAGMGIDKQKNKSITIGEFDDICAGKKINVEKGGQSQKPNQSNRKEHNMSIGDLIQELFSETIVMGVPLNKSA
ncbi:MAG: hypothetical protein JXR56_08850 [Candidatus Cloacimonetes bacterium]|nr:hypothetical protein [Candidatus Cloacimonadota bacterium]